MPAAGRPKRSSEGSPRTPRTAIAWSARHCPAQPTTPRRWVDSRRGASHRPASRDGSHCPLHGHLRRRRTESPALAMRRSSPRSCPGQGLKLNGRTARARSACSAAHCPPASGRSKNQPRFHAAWVCEPRPRDFPARRHPQAARRPPATRNWTCVHASPGSQPRTPRAA